jgi:hypothetical protein
VLEREGGEGRDRFGVGIRIGWMSGGNRICTGMQEGRPRCLISTRIAVRFMVRFMPHSLQCATV